MRARIQIAALGVLLAQCMAAPGQADDEFFKGKTVTFVVSTAPGGGYDTYGRLLSRHLGRHVPGNPGVVAANIAALDSAAPIAHLVERGRGY